MTSERAGRALATTESIASLREVSVTYRTSGRPSGRTPGRTSGEGVDALVDVTIDIAAETTTALSGPSGSGKSTLLRLIALFDRPNDGTITVAGVDVTRMRERARRSMRRRSIAFVHQRPLSNLVSGLRVDEHITFVRSVRRLVRVDPQPTLEQFGLAGVARSWPWQLSGGEQQRLAFAMAVAGGAELILADEPTAELDRQHVEEVIESIAMLEGAGVSTIVASHDPAVVAAASRIVGLHDGRVVTT